MQADLAVAVPGAVQRSRPFSPPERTTAQQPDTATAADDSTGIVILTDKAGVVISLNAPARQLTGLGPGASVADIAWSPEAVRKFLSQISQTDTPLPLTISKPDGQAAFLLGMRQDQDETIILSEVRRGIDPQIMQGLARATDLNQSELHALQGVMAGKSAEEIASDLKRRPGTIRQLIKGIMAKMGVHTQQQLISIVYSMSLMAARSRAVPDCDQNRPEPQSAAQAPMLCAGPDAKAGLHRFGLQNGIPVLFFHGALFGIAGHDPMRNAAEVLGLHVIAPERPGYGSTPRGTGQDPVALACGQALEILDQLAIARVVVLGHDIGTLYAVQFARRFPDRVAAVVAAPATPPMQRWSQTADMPARQRVNAWAAQNMPDLMDKIVGIGLSHIGRKGVGVMPGLVFDGCRFDQGVLLRPEMENALQDSFSLAWAQEGAGFREDMRLTNLNWQADLAEVAVPVLCLHGAHSQTVSHRAVAQLAQDLPRGQFRLVADAGHSMPLSHTAYILRQVQALARDFGLAETSADTFFRESSKAPE